MPEADVPVRVPGTKLRSLVTDTQAVAAARIPHGLGGGKGGRIDDVCSFADLARRLLHDKLKEIASRRKPGGYPMWVVVKKCFSSSDSDAKRICELLEYDPETTVRDRE